MDVGNFDGNFDFDGVYYRGRNKNISIDQFEWLDKYYSGIWNDVKNIIKDEGNWVNIVRRLVGVACDYEVGYIHYMKSALELVDSEELSPYMRESIKILSPFMTDMNIFSGSGCDVVGLYVAEKILPLLSEKTDVRVFGTELDWVDGIIKKEKKIWDSFARAEKAKELTGDNISVNIGDSNNDIPMVESGTYSFILTKGKEKKEGNIIYTTEKNLPNHLRKIISDLS